VISVFVLHVHFVSSACFACCLHTTQSKHTVLPSTIVAWWQYVYLTKQPRKEEKKIAPSKRSLISNMESCGENSPSLYAVQTPLAVSL